MNKQFTQPHKVVNVETNKQAIARDFGIKANEVVYLNKVVPLDGYLIAYDQSTQTTWEIGTATGIPSEWVIAGDSLSVLTSIGTYTLKKAYDIHSLNTDKLFDPLGLGLVFNQPKSGNFWTDVHEDAKIHRMNDRLLFGAAVANDGKITTERTADNKDWLEVIRGSTTNNAQVAVISTIGQCALLGASRTSDFGLADSMGCIGLQGWAINDNIDQLQTAYGAYLEVRRNVGAGRTHGFELDVVNYGNLVSIQPYDMFQQGLTVGGWIASGGEFSVTDASAALAIINNGSAWEKGLVFHSIALKGTDGITGTGVAIEMAKGHVIRWMFGSGSQGASVVSSVSNSAAEQSIQFTDVGLLFRNATSKNLFQVDVSNTFVNGLRITGGNIGVSPGLLAQGDDTNLDLRLVPKGTGRVHIQNATVSASAGAQLGFYVQKINNTEVKIPYYAMS